MEGIATTTCDSSAGAATTEHVPDRAHGFVQATALVTVLVGVTSLVVWVTGHLALVRVVSSWPAMAPYTAVSLVLAGSSLWLLSQGRGRLRYRRAGLVLAGAVGVVGATTIFEYLSGVDLGVDRLLFDGLVGRVGRTHPGRPSLYTAVGLLLAAIALLALEVRGDRWRRSAAVVAPLSAALALLIVMAYAYGASYLRGATGMAAPTAAALLSLNVGILLARPDRMPALAFTGRGPTASLARRLLLGVLLVPAILGIASELQARYDLIEPATGRAAAMLITIALLLVAKGLTLRAARRAEAQAEAAVNGARRAEREAAWHATLLSNVVNSISDGVTVVDERGGVIIQNPAALDLVGVPGEDVAIESWAPRFQTFRPDAATPFPYDELPLVKAMHGQTARNVEMVIRNPAKPDGVALNVSAHPLLVSGVQVGAVAVLHDVTQQRRAWAKLHASEERLGLLLTGAQDFTINSLDRDGRLTSCSAATSRQTGYTESELLGQQFAMLFVDEDRATDVPAMLLREAEAHGRASFEGQRLRKDGSRYWASTTIHAHTSAVDEQGGFAIISHDITAQRLSEIKFRGLLEAAPVAIIGVDPEGKILLVNAKTEQLFGYRRDELLGSSVDTLVPETNRPGHAKQRAQYAENPSLWTGVGLDLTARRRDGSCFPVEIGLSTLDTEDGLIVTAAIADMTDREQAEQELARLNRQLRTLNDELEQRVWQRTAELRHQTADLKRINEELEAFSYSVSHDLRAPLRTVGGFATIVAEEYGDKLDDIGRGYLGKIQAGGRQMGQLIDGLLAFSRLQRQDLTVAPVDMEALVREVWDQLAPTRTDRTIRFTVGRLPSCMADARLLWHVVTNLLDNAAKYTRDRDDTEVEVGSLEGDAGRSVYYVRDNGVGFDMRYRDKLFTVFQRLHRAEDFEGTGIGLALAARVIHRHGGVIWAEAAPGRGATFFFSLSRTGETADELHPVDSPAGRGQSE